jgi:hypothetical protein
MIPFCINSHTPIIFSIRLQLNLAALFHEIILHLLEDLHLFSNLEKLFNMPAAEEICPANPCTPPARFPPVNLFSVPDISAVMLLVDPATDCRVDIPPATVLCMVLPNTA